MDSISESSREKNGSISERLQEYAMLHGMSCEVKTGYCGDRVDITFFGRYSNTVIRHFETSIKYRTADEIVKKTILEMEKFWADNEKKKRAAEIVDHKFNVPTDRNRLPYIEQVIFHDPATIVYWADRTRTVVKCQDGDVYDPEKGLAMAICKKALGNKGNYCEVFKQWLPEEEVETLDQRIIDAANKIVQSAFEKWQYEHQKDVK